MLKFKIKRWMKDTKKAVIIYLTFPSTWILFAILVLSVISFLLSIYYCNKNNYFSSLFLSLFTGFITGIVICLITTVKSIWLYRTESKINWINEVHTMYIEFIKKHQELVLLGKDLDRADIYDEIYDLLCMGNNISCKISQDRYSKEIPFNPYVFCKKQFKFDAVSIMESNEEVRDAIVYKYFDLSSNELRLVFEKMEKPLSDLNLKLIKEKDRLLIKMKYMKVSVL